MANKVHFLKTYPKYFRQTLAGKKTFEIRLNDRDYKVHDLVILKEWDGFCFTGRKIRGQISYILSDKFCGLSKDFVAFALDFKMKIYN